jgi:hypothetical protein
MIFVPGRKPHRETLHWIAGSDAVLLAAAGGEGADLQIPNKLYEYLALKRPIVALCSRNNPIRDILDEAGAICTYADAWDVSEISRALAHAPSLEHSDPTGAWSGVGRFDRRRRAGELAAVFHRLAKAEARPPLVVDRRVGWANAAVTASMARVIPRPGGEHGEIALSATARRTCV